MSELDLEEDNLLNIDFCMTIITIGAFILLAIITYNDKLVVEKKKPIMSEKESDDLLLFYRILIIIISLILLNNSFKSKNLAIKKRMNIKPFDLQIIASIALVIAAIIALYAVLISKDQESTELLVMGNQGI